ncbi:MAG: aldehyde dehydrogenase family protein [Bacteroidota bacterium]
MQGGIQGFILGGERKHLSPTSERVVSVHSPWDGFPVGTVFLASESDAHEAVEKAVMGFERTRALSSLERSEILSFVAGRLKERMDEFSRLITSEVGKPIQWSRVEVDRAIFTFQLAAEEAKRIGGEVLPLDLNRASAGKFGIVRRFPLGVILCITPFNYPLNLVAHKVAPAIASGNSFILKPASHAPLTALELGEIIGASGYPREAFSVLPCSDEVAQTLVTDERIKMLSFTGSAGVGWKLKSMAGKKKVLLELGGNAGVIIDRTANLDEAVKKNLTAAFLYSGQVCIKVQRIYVHKDLYDTFREKFLEEVRSLKYGDPNDPTTVCGPLIDDKASERVSQWVRESVADGAAIAAGGTRNGRVVEPTVLEHVKITSDVFRKEIFGPVVTFHSFKTIEEAVAGMNDSTFGLQAGIFSNDLKNILYAYNNIEAGAVIVNDTPSYRVDHMPYGGVKDSGFGREGIRYAIEAMTEPKLLVLGS